MHCPPPHATTSPFQRKSLNPSSTPYLIAARMSSDVGLPGSVRKRPRPVISCLRCREKKLKCDRVSPCENCSRAGCAPNCVFLHGTPAASEPKRARSGSAVTPEQNGPSGGSGGTGAGVGLIEDLQQRLKRVEEMLNIGSEKAISITGGLPARTAKVGKRQVADSGRRYPGTLVVKGTRTRYRGQNDRMALIQEFEGAKDLVGACTQDDAIFRVAKEVQFLQRRSTMPVETPDSQPDLDASVELQQMEQNMPSMEVCDKLMGTYATNFEDAMRVFHIPTLYRQYADFWSNPDRGSEHYAMFVPQLTAIMAATVALVDEEFQQAYPAAVEYLTKPAINLVRSWLSKLSRKQRTELTNLQTEALVLSARYMHFETPEEVWRITGALVRSAMVMGLHVDLSAYTDLSVFQKEVRRRLWITIVELDLQSSIMSGMPITIPDIDFTPLMPLNICDVDYHPDMTELPPAKPFTEWTDTLSQIALAMSLSARIRAMAMVQTPGPNLNLDDAMEQGRRIAECLRQIPPPLRLDPPAVPDDPAPQLFNRVRLNLYIRRPLISLYRSIIKKCGAAETPPEVWDTLLSSSLSVLSYLDYFDPSVSDIDYHNLPGYWHLFQTFCRNDILQAALSVCAYMRLAPSPWRAPHSKANLIRAVESALDGMARTTDKPGSELKDILLLSVVLNLVRARGSEEDQKEIVKQGVLKAMMTCREHLASTVGQPLPQQQQQQTQQTQQFGQDGVQLQDQIHSAAQSQAQTQPDTQMAQATPQVCPV